MIFLWSLSVRCSLGALQKFGEHCCFCSFFSHIFDPQSCSRSSLSTESWDCLPKINISQNWRDIHESQGSRESRIGYLLYSPQGQTWAHTRQPMAFPKPPFTSCHWIIFQANPSKKLWKLHLPPQHEMQSLCCPIQLVVTTPAPKNKLWKRREGKNHLSWLTWVLFLAWNRNFVTKKPPHSDSQGHNNLQNKAQWHRLKFP